MFQIRSGPYSRLQRAGPIPSDRNNVLDSSTTRVPPKALFGCGKYTGHVRAIAPHPGQRVGGTSVAEELGRYSDRMGWTPLLCVCVCVSGWRDVGQILANILPCVFIFCMEGHYARVSMLGKYGQVGALCEEEGRGGGASPRIAA